MEPGHRRKPLSTLLRGALANRLVHFLVLGGLVFAFVPRERDGRVVRIDAARVERALRDEQSRLGRPLSTAEKQSLMQSLVDDELLYREGRRLGLDENDPVVRGRVAESMRRSLAEAVPASAIDETELRREAEAIAARSPLRVRLALWFVSSDRPDAARVAERVAHDVKDAGGERPEPKSPDRPPIPEDATYTEEALARAAGAGVARAAFASPLGTVSDPVASAWGFYVIRPIERRPMDPAEARAQALASLRARKATAEVARAAARAAQDWDVVVDAPRGEPGYEPGRPGAAGASPGAGGAM